MDIITKSIKDNIEIQLNKPIEAVSREELLDIKKITINRVGFDEGIQKVSYDEIVYFENLEELNIFNCMIDKALIDNIVSLKNLKVLKVYDSDFVDYVDNMFSNMNLNELTISNCLGLNNIILKNLKYLDLKNMHIDFLIKDVETLNISNTNMNVRALKLVNVNKIIMSEINYDEGIKLDNIKTNIIIIDDKMNIIKEMKINEV